ncbi:MAG: hypothetical protein KAT77_06435 [Nanoarchaeota archaeon]|nr:hypothetical protein [Nanoarchaeota archaeon]
MVYKQQIVIPLSPDVIKAIGKVMPKDKDASPRNEEGPKEDEYIILTKDLPEYREEPNVIQLRDGQILQVGLKKDEEDLEEYIKAVNKLSESVYRDHNIRVVWEPNKEGAVSNYFEAGDILFQFEKKFKELFFGVQYILKIYHYSWASFEPRIKFKSEINSEILKTFPEFESKKSWVKYQIQYMPKGLVYEDDYSFHEGYFEYLEDDEDYEELNDEDLEEIIERRKKRKS